MKVSIIIPIYNVTKYIQSCLESVVNQTMVKDVECILVDDCGTDNSITVAQQFVESYEGDIIFSVLHHQQNRGLSAARNTGIKAAKGDYLYFLDSDDEIVTNCIEILYNLSQKYGTVDLVQGAYNTEYPYMQKFKDIHYPEYSCDKKYIKSALLNYDYMPTMAQNRLVKRDVIVKNNLYFKEGIIHEDMHWSFFLAKHINTMCFCNIPTYYYRLTPGSITSHVNLDKESIALSTIILDFCQNLDGEYIGAQKVTILNHLVTYLKLPLETNKNDKHSLVKEVSKNNTIIENIFLKLYLHTRSAKMLHLLIRIYNQD